MKVGDRIFIKYSGDIVSFGQCYDGMTGKIDGCVGDRYQITLDVKSREKINKINYKINSGGRWSLHPIIPFKYVYAYNKNLEVE